MGHGAFQTRLAHVRPKRFGQPFEPLKELVLGERVAGNTIEGWINGVKFLCTVYDPSAGAYRFDYSIFVGAAVGIACLGGLAWFLVGAWRERSAHDRQLRERAS